MYLPEGHARSSSSSSSQHHQQQLQEFVLLTERLRHLGEPPQDVLSVLFESNFDVQQTQQQRGTNNKQRDGKNLTTTNNDSNQKGEDHDDGFSLQKEVEHLLKNFEEIIFGEENDEKKQEDERTRTCERSGKDETGRNTVGTGNRSSDRDGDDDDITKDDVQAFLKFLGGLGLTGDEADNFLDPETLMKAATGEIREEELVQMILEKEKNIMMTTRASENEDKDKRCNSSETLKETPNEFKFYGNDK